MRILLPFFAAVTSITAVLTCAQSPSPHPPLDAKQVHAIDDFVASEMAHQKIPGLAIGVYSRGAILLARGYGQANVELAVPVKPETIFQSGSVGKQFISAAIMMLVEEGKMGDARKNCSIIMMDRNYTPAARWDFTNAWPIKVTGPGVKSDDNSFAVEELVLAHEGLKRVKV